MITHLNVNSLRLKSNSLMEMVSEIKSDNNFHEIKFPIEGYSKPKKTD